MRDNLKKKNKAVTCKLQNRSLKWEWNLDNLIIIIFFCSRSPELFGSTEYNYEQYFFFFILNNVYVKHVILSLKTFPTSAKRIIIDLTSKLHWNYWLSPQNFEIFQNKSIFSLTKQKLSSYLTKTERKKKSNHLA